MLADALEHSGSNPLAPGYAELLCVIRLQEIALAAPPALVALRAMIDALVTVPGVFRAVVAVAGPREGRVNYIAHVGKNGLRPHAPHVQAPSPMLAKALRDGELIQLARSDGSRPHNCVNVPIRGLAQVLGVLGIGVTPASPLDPWREQFVWSVAEIMALPLLGAEVPGTVDVQRDSPLGRLTRRQQECLLALADGGAGNQEIGQRLSLSPHTVKAHLQIAFRILGVKRRSDAVRLLLTEHPHWCARARLLLPPRPGK
jgi:DNA-binding CsgD family transcriptional regulator